MFRLPLFACAALVISACNLSDTVQRPSDPGVSFCETNADCNGRGVCDIVDGAGLCLCNGGYLGLYCEECASDYVLNGDVCEPVDPTCEDGEVYIGRICVADACANNPCGDGVCATTGAGRWTCDCPDGSSGEECTTCEDTCESGTCDEDGVCICDEGWTGDNCDTCDEGYSGEACECTSESCISCDMLAPTPWWSNDAVARHAIIVTAPTGDVIDGAVVPVRFNHTQLIEAGARPTGTDLKFVYTDEIDAVKGIDTRWANDQTEMRFATQAPIAHGGFDVYYLYVDHDGARPLRDVRNVMRQDRGWYHETNAGFSLYASDSILNDIGLQPSILQLRQTDIDHVEVTFVGQGDGAISVETGTGIDLGLFSGVSGTFGNPFILREQLNPALLVDEYELVFTMLVGPQAVDSGEVYLGARRFLSTFEEASGVANFTRSMNFQTEAPQATVCAIEFPNQTPD